MKTLFQTNALILGLMVLAGCSAYTSRAFAAAQMIAGNGPQTGLVQGQDGSIYGTTYFGGGSANCQLGCGTIFRVSPAGKASTIHKFNGVSGYSPGPVGVGADGNIYGAAGGESGTFGGAVYKLSATGQFTKLSTLSTHNFVAPPWANLGVAAGKFFLPDLGGQSVLIFGPGSRPVYNRSISMLGRNTIESGLIVGTDGALYGGSEGWSKATNNYNCPYKVLLTGKATNLRCGSDPSGTGLSSSLALGVDGKLYGLSQGASDVAPGEFFSVDVDGTYTTLADVAITTCLEVANGLTLGNDGNFYATCAIGGVYGGGTLVKLSPGGVVTVLHSFGYLDEKTLGYPDGQGPSGVLLKASDGTLWGTTVGGGVTCPVSNPECPYQEGYGTVFHYSLTSGNFEVVVKFSGK